MVSNPILTALLSSRFMVASHQESMLLEYAQQYLLGTLPKDFFNSQRQLPNELKHLQSYGADAYDSQEKPVITQSGTFILPIMGTIMKYDYCGSPGTQTMRQWIQEANNDPNVKSGLLYINSGGGMAEGTWELAQDIANATFPIETYIDGTCCSAAYYLAAATKKITCSSPDNMVGSIGVASKFVSYQKQLETAGVTSKMLYASTSPLKHGATKQLLAGEDPQHLQEFELDPLDQTFMDFVKTNRPQISEQALSGLEVIASKSLEINSGLIDGIDTLPNVLAGLSAQKRKNTNMKKTYLLTTDNAFVLQGIKTAMGFGSDTELKDYAPDEATQSLQANLDTLTKQKDDVIQERDTATASLTTAQGKISDLQASLESANQAKTTLQTDKDAADAKVLELTTKVASYEKPAGTVPVLETPPALPIMQDANAGIPAFKENTEASKKIASMGPVN
jgi:protease IV